MSSPFPGMDPFVESQKWEDFHTRFISAIGDALVPSVRPRYVVEVERRVYLESQDGETTHRAFVADVAVETQVSSAPAKPVSQSESAATTGVAIEPKACTIPFPEEHREAFITIRKGQARDIVTIIELLSPTNKRLGTDGRRQYVDKMLELVQTKVHFVELDLLRGGQRTAVGDPPKGDFFAIVSRAGRRPLADVYGWPMSHPMPSIAIPLSGDDPDVMLDLQSVFNLVYDRAGYDYSIDYSQTVLPMLSDENAKWVAEKLG